MLSICHLKTILSTLYYIQCIQSLSYRNTFYQFYSDTLFPPKQLGKATNSFYFSYIHIVHEKCVE